MKYQLWLDNYSGLGTSKKNHIINDSLSARDIYYMEEASLKKIEYLTAAKRGGNADMLLSELEECIPDTSKDMDHALEARELGRYLNQFIGTLKEGDRKLFLARYYYAMTAPQLAEQYGCSVRQVKYRLEKMRNKLKCYLQEEGVNV